eukprot:s4062_g3.t1
MSRDYAAPATPMEVIQSVFMRGKRPMATPRSQRWRGKEADSPILDSPKSAAPPPTVASSEGSRRRKLEDGAGLPLPKRAKVEEVLDGSTSPLTQVAWRSVVAQRARCGPETTLGELLFAKPSSERCEGLDA